jgi:hypothetical protein
MSGRKIMRLFRVAVALMTLATPAVAQPACTVAPAFDRTDEGGRTTLTVYRETDVPEASAPYLFVSGLKVNTDGTKISYKVDDPHAEHGAINDMKYALTKGSTIDEYRAIAAADWLPLDKTWSILNPDVIEQAKDGKPCVTPDGYLVSMTSVGSVADAYDRVGDCDQSKWLDSLSVPALVLPTGHTEFRAHGITTRSVGVAMTVDPSHRLSLGIVGDEGPPDQLGEASVAMNNELNGMPPDAVPTSDADAVERFQGPPSIVILFPGSENRLGFPLTRDSVEAGAKAAFDAWGGEARLVACLQSLG